MKILLLILVGVGIAQTSGAAEITFTSDSTLSGTMSNISTSANYDASDNIYKTNSGAHIYTNEEISKAIDDLSTHTKQREYQIASLNSRLEYENKVSPHKDSLDDMKRWANQGNSEYQLKVGWIYYEGKGVRQNLVLARRMFQKAADKGDPEGQAMVGFFYEEGIGGLKRNRATAKEWYGKICDKGFQFGCDNYRRLNEQSY